ncbi:ROK family protein [Microbacterium betulae]|uniref:ROK family protein n=1 Tax=Microbacterium betulae TaxID=2981139 RepID=A0AA97FI56_9MICO|nr:ROK family protein [Microbacterium sp. AB]WOF23338.1 ROK family protein [Microbacterium sp. AB]
MTTTDHANALTAGALFQRLRDGVARTRGDLVADTGLGRAAVAARVDALLAAGLLVPAGAASSTGGRPPQVVRFDAHAGATLALDFGARHATIGLADLSGEPIATVSRELDIAEGPETCLRLALDQARELLRDSRAELFGVGVGVPGPVEHSTGRPVNPPIMPGWDGFDIPGAVREELDGEVQVDNDVNILAIGEHALRGGAVDDLVYVKVATGIGAGIISGGLLQRGALGSAGDLGHIHVRLPESPLVAPGDERDLEAVASGTAVAAALRERGTPAHSNADVVRLIQAGDADAITLTREAGRVLGEALAIVVNLMNPSMIVIGGSLGRVADHLIAGAREVVYRRSIPLATQHLRIEPSRGGVTAGVRGAATMALQAALSPAAVDRRLAAQG